MIGVASAVLAGLSVAGGVAQMLNASKKASQARNAAQAGINQMKAIEQQNKLKALQAPDVSSMMSQEAAATTAQSVQALQEMGGAGAANIANVYKQGLDQQQAAAEKQAQVNYDRDATVLQQDQAIEGARVAKEMGMAEAEIEGARTAERDANNQMWAGLQSITGGVEQGVGAYGDLTGPYGTREANIAKKNWIEAGGTEDNFKTHGYDQTNKSWVDYNSIDWNKQ